MADYYEELARGGDALRMAGWRHPLEQALRFEVALESVPWRASTSVLDLGCGTGALYGYLAESGRPCASYLGVDRLEASIVRARQCWPEAEFWTADALELSVLPRASLVIGIGCLVDGTAAISDGARYGRLRRWLTRGWRHCTEALCLIVLRQELLDANPSIQESALVGARCLELETLARSLSPHWAIRDDFLSSSWGLMVWRSPPPHWPPRRWAAHERVLSSTDGAPWSRSEQAWLWFHSGHLERAEHILRPQSGQWPNDERADALRARLDLARSHSSAEVQS